MSTTLSRRTKLPSDERFVIHNVDWETYDAILTALGDRPLRLTFDGKCLEFMSPSVPHEWFKSILRKLIDALALELMIALRSGGSTTFRRVGERGLEPDECYWIASEPLVRGKKNIDLEVDPPPDLAIEIDITRSSLDREEIYKRLKIPEIWRYDGESLRVYLLNEHGEYELSAESRSFPFLPVRELERFLDIDDDTEETTRIWQFVEWVRAQGFRT